MASLDIKRALLAVPVFAKLEDQALAAVLTGGTLTHYRANRQLIAEGDVADRVFLLLCGCVRVFHRASDGREVLVKLFAGPALFGEMEVLGEIPFQEYVVTLEPADILTVRAELFRKIVDKQGDFAAALARDLAARLCVATANEKALAFSEVDARVADVLLDYADLAGEKDDAGRIRIPLPLSQDGLAKDTGVSRKSLVRCLGKFREEGLVTKEDARYVIAKPDDLRRLGSRGLRLRYSLHR